MLTRCFCLGRGFSASTGRTDGLSSQHRHWLSPGWLFLAGASAAIAWIGAGHVASRAYMANVKLLRYVYALSAAAETLVVAPGVWQAFRFHRDSRRLARSAFRRYLVWRLGKIAAGTLVVLVAVYTVIPLSLNCHRWVVVETAMPAYLRKLDVLAVELAAYPVDRSAEADVSRAVMEYLDQAQSTSTLRAALFQDEDGRALEQIDPSLATPLLVGMLTITLICLSIAPYLVLGGSWRTAVVFLILVAGTWLWGELVARYAARAFLLPAGSAASIVLLCVLILSSEAFSDWIFDESSDKPILCQYCGEEIDERDQYCSSCGALQHSLPEEGRETGRGR